MAPIVIFAILLASVQAAVLNDAATCIPFTDTYEDLPDVPVLPEFSPVGKDNGLAYTGWIVATVGKGKVIGTGFTEGVIQKGTFSYLPSGSISIDQTAGTISFSAQSVEIGCFFNTLETAVLVPETCMVTVSSTYVDGKTGPSRTFTFNGGALTKVTLPSAFTGLQSIVVAVSNALPILTALQMNNFEHCNTK